MSQKYNKYMYSCTAFSSMFLYSLWFLFGFGCSLVSKCYNIGLAD